MDKSYQKQYFSYTDEEHKLLLKTFDNMNMDLKRSKFILEIAAKSFVKAQKSSCNAANPVQWLLMQTEYKIDYKNRSAQYNKVDDVKLRQITYDLKPSTIYNNFMSNNFPDGFGKLFRKLCIMNDTLPETIYYYKLILNK